MPAPDLDALQLLATKYPDGHVAIMSDELLALVRVAKAAQKMGHGKTAARWAAYRETMQAVRALTGGE